MSLQAWVLTGSSPEGITDFAPIDDTVDHEAGGDCPCGPEYLPPMPGIPACWRHWRLTP